MNRPQSLEELYNHFYPGLVVFDAGSKMPEWLRTCMEMRSLTVNRCDAMLLLSGSSGREVINKLVYITSKTEHCITMACVYDDWGIIYAIQI